MAFDIAKKVQFVMSLEGADKVQSGFRTVADGAWDTERAMGLAQKAFAAFIGVAGVSAFAGMVRGSIEGTAALHDLSIQTGMSVAALAQFRSVGSLSETSAESIATATTKLSKAMAMTSEEGKGATIALKALGIDFETFKRLAPEQQMLAVAQAMGGFNDGADKSAAAMLLYGKEGAKLLPFLGDLAEQHDQITAKLTDQEVALKKAQAAMADAFGDNLTKIRKESEGWKKDLSMGLLPALYEASEAVLGMGKGTGGLKDEISKLAKDGTLADWARGAMTAFSYLLDVGQGLFSLFPMLAKLIAGVAAGTGTLFSGIFEAMQLLKSGDIAGAWESMKSGFAGVRSIAVDTGTDIANIWGQKLLGATFRARMEDLRGTSAEAGATKATMAGLSDVAKQFDEQRKAGEASARAAAAAEKKLREEYERAVKAGQELMAGIAKKNTAMQLELDMGRKLTTAEKERLDLEDKLRKGKVALTQAEKDATNAAIDYGRELEQNIRWIEDTTKANNAARDAIDKSADDVAKLIKAQRESNTVLGLSKDALHAHELALLADKAAALELRAELLDLVDPSAAQALRDQAEQWRTLAALKRENFDKGAAQETATAWLQTMQTIGGGFVDALIGGADSAKAYIVKTFKDMVIKVPLQALVNDAAGSVASLLAGLVGGGSGGGGGGGAGGTGGLVNNLSSLGSAAYKLYGSYFGAGSASAIGADAATSAAWSSGAGLGGDTLSAMGMAEGAGAGTAAAGGGAGTTAGAGASWGSVAGYAALVYAATQYASSLYNKGFTGSDNIKGKGWYELTPEASQTSILKAIGLSDKWSEILGGSVRLNQMFGHAAPRVDASGVTGTFSGGQFTGQNYADITEKGGLFRSDKHYTQTAAMDAAMSQFFNDAAGSVLKQAKAYGDALGLPAEQLATISSDIKVALTDDSAANSAAITKALGGYGDALMAGYAEVIKPLQKAGESTAQTIERVAGTLTSVNDTFGVLGMHLLDASIAGGKAATAIVDMAGGMDAFNAKAADYFKLYYSDGEQMALKAQGILQQLSAVGIDGGAANERSDLRTAMESIDPNSTQGGAQIATLLNIAGSYADVSKYLEENNISLGDLAAQAPNSELLTAIKTPSEVTATATTTTAVETAAMHQELVDMNTSTQAQNVEIIDQLREQNRILGSWNSFGLKTEPV